MSKEYFEYQRFSVSRDKWYHWPIRFMLRLYRTDGFISCKDDMTLEVYKVYKRKN